MTDRARILLVDDRPENLLALEAILSSLEHTLVSAESGEEALRELLKNDYALILLDAQMPGMDGFETAARIKRRARTRDVPIIFLTAADAEQRNSYRGYAAGGADYITKPFDPWILRAKVQVFVDLSQARQRVAKQAELLRSQFDEGSTLDDLRSLVTQVGQAADRLEAAVDSGEQPDIRAGLHDVRRQVKALQSVLSALDPLDPTSNPVSASQRDGG